MVQGSRHFFRGVAVFLCLVSGRRLLVTGVGADLAAMLWLGNRLRAGSYGVWSRSRDGLLQGAVGNSGTGCALGYGKGFMAAILGAVYTQLQNSGETGAKFCRFVPLNRDRGMQNAFTVARKGV